MATDKMYTNVSFLGTFPTFPLLFSYLEGVIFKARLLPGYLGGGGGQHFALVCFGLLER